MQIKSLVRSRTDLFDFSAAALAAGGATSLALFLAGLAASHGGAVAEPGLLPVPAQLFQGSLLLGGIARLGLSADALSHAQVFVSPLLVGGWCGLVTTALNCLPVGNLDGGRAFLVRRAGAGRRAPVPAGRAPPLLRSTLRQPVPPLPSPPRLQSAFGRSSLAVSSLLSYVGLGLGLLGSSLALPFGLYVLICQRTAGARLRAPAVGTACGVWCSCGGRHPADGSGFACPATRALIRPLPPRRAAHPSPSAEQYIQDEVSGVSERRRAIAAVLVAFAVLTLIPMAPDVADLAAVGSPGNFI